MKKTLSVTFFSILLALTICQAHYEPTDLLENRTTTGLKLGPNDEYEGQVTFPAGFVVGDYIEFLKTSPINAGSSGYYEISISYLRNSIAAGATYIASVAHSNNNSQDLWREAGRINSNGYASSGSAGHNFAVDFNTLYGNSRMRVRAINTLGSRTEPLTVRIKVRSINANAGWTVLNATGNDLTVNKLLPMTNDWSLYVGNTYKIDGAQIAIKALENGNVGIGTATPDSKLSVNGNIRAKEIKVENGNWPDYVFAKSYQLPTLEETEQHINDKNHLPGIPSAKDVEQNGVDLGEMNALLLKKIEELTLYLIRENKINASNLKRLDEQDLKIKLLTEKLEGTRK